MADSKLLVLVDGSSFLYRAFFAARNGFTTSNGIPTGASLIIARMFANLIKDFKNAKIAVIFDARGKSFRNEIYPEYKANRPSMPDDLRVQIEYVHAIVKAMGLPLISISGVEADDVIGTYVTKARDYDLDVIIATGDKDLAQFVSERVKIYDSMNNEIIDSDSVFDKFGVPPHLIVDYLAIKGDKVDNIPGMPGAGDVTTSALLNNLGGIYDIYAKRDQIATLSFRGAKTFAKKYEEHFAQVELSYKLASIKTDVELTLDIDDIKPPVMHKEELLAIYKELEFKRLYDALLKEGDESTDTADTTSQDKRALETGFVTFDESRPTLVPKQKLQDKKENGLMLELVQSDEQLELIAAAIKDAGFMVVDTETTSLNAMEADLVGISLCTDDKKAFYIPIKHNEQSLGLYHNMALESVRQILGPVFADSSIKKIGHNIKYDMIILKNADLELHNIYFDTLLAFHAIRSSLRLSMDALAESFLNYITISYEDVCGKGAKAIGFDSVIIEKAVDYAAEDAYVTYELYKKAAELLDKCQSVKDYFFAEQMPLIPVLFNMEYKGTLVSGGELYTQTLELNDIMIDCQKQIYASAGCEFNISSPKQLSEVLFVKMGIPYPKKPKKGKDGSLSYSTSEDILSAIAPDYDIANLILRYRAVSKLISTYTEKLPQLISAKTGRIHTSFNPAGTVTGRLSSSDPNLQNIPARTHEGRLIRTAFCAPVGYKIVSADYSQIELRLIAHLSGDDGLINAFLKHADIHRATAAEVLGISADEVSDAQRAEAKATNFGLMYGMQAHGLAAQTGMDFKEAKLYIERYFARYPKVKAYMADIVSNASKDGYVSTISGSRIYYDALNSDNAIARKAAERAAINAPMQGSAADIIKLAMIKINAWIESLTDKSLIVMTMQVHDELVFEIKESFVDEALAKIREIMESAVSLKVPLEVGIGVADNWGDAH